MNAINAVNSPKVSVREYRGTSKPIPLMDGFEEGEWGELEWESDDNNPAWNILTDNSILGYMQEGEY